ncbi:MAG: PmeII family type II restriction endonuclease [Nitrospira sp.]|nr:PmeII family type II restriction endonuclease [Nitrospira sp.]
MSRYVETNIGEFHQRRIQNLEKLKLLSVLRRKNPYLFRAKNVLTADQIIKGLVDSHIASHEETIFGNWLEGLAIFVNQMVYGGRKSGMTGIDLEFETENRRYIVAIKSGPNWGNSSQVSKMKTDFRTAMKTLRTSNSQLNIVAVNGCCYGKENTPDKGDYFKYCGQKFWEFISGDNDLFTEIIEPLGYKAKEKNEEFLMAYSQTLNKFTREFANRLCDDNGKIDWEKLVRLNSARNENVSDS